MKMFSKRRLLAAAAVAIVATLAAIGGQSEILSRVRAELFHVRKGGATIGFRLPGPEHVEVRAVEHVNCLSHLRSRTYSVRRKTPEFGSLYVTREPRGSLNALVLRFKYLTLFAKRRVEPTEIAG